MENGDDKKTFDAATAVETRCVGVTAKRMMPQVVTTLAVTLGSFLCGTALGWSGPAIPSLKEELCRPECDIPGISDTDASWIGGLMPAGAISSGIVTAWLLGRIGRKWTLAVCSVPFLIGCICFVLAHQIQNKAPLFLGRFLTGFSGGACRLIPPIYIMEISEPRWRGALATVAHLMLIFGILCVNAMSINGAMGWMLISTVLIAIPFMLCVGMTLVPESPVFLLQQDKKPEALRALTWLRGDAGDAQRALDAMAARKSDAEGVSLKTLLTQTQYSGPFAIMMALMFFMQFSGINFVTFYQQEIFLNAGSPHDKGLNATLVFLAQMGGTLLAILIVERVGRKVLLSASVLLMGLSMVTLGTFFYLKDVHLAKTNVTCSNSNGTSDEVRPLTVGLSNGTCLPDNDFDDLVDDLAWLPLTSLVVYMVAFSIGIGPLPFAMNGEIFFPEAKSLSSSLAGAFSWFCAFLVTTFQSTLASALGTHGVYFFFACSCAVAVLFIVVAVPETKGMTPEQIREKLARRVRKT